jgi:hypothetical protein
MSEPTPTRRKVLSAGAGAAALVPVVTMAHAAGHPPAFPLAHDCDLELLELRRTIDAYQAAVRPRTEPGKLSRV